jgi:hypothetical protein
MIVSYARKFIFIKTKKTAGTTAEAVLATGCAPGDIVTHPSGKYVGMDLARFVSFFGEGGNTPMEIDDEEGTDKARGRKHGEFYNHMMAGEIRDKVDRTFWDSACKLTIERHPYEKAVSQAYWRQLKKKKLSSEDFPTTLDRVVRTGDYVGFKRWSIDRKIAVDDFIRHETLLADLTRIGKRLGFPVPQTLPQLKNQTRLDHRPAKEILSEEQREIVFQRCREEFEILGYKR